ncbi:MAG TPA: hypothetical protein VMS71_01815, partial [Candidatus Acidoferrum sp.]|nr:hypothetical protein [Candidatus Acidoferrum sp.]
RDCHAAADSSRTALDRLIPKMESCGKCHAIDNYEKCGLCHTHDIEPSGIPRPDWSIVFNHQLHLVADSNCQGCHPGVVQAAELTRANMPSMESCLNCHDGKKASDKCEVCHAQDVTLADIHPTGWRHDHAQRATVDKQWCTQCHRQETYCIECHRGDNITARTHDLNYQFTHGLDAKGKVAECARCHDTRLFCDDCHLKEHRIPLNHSLLSWRTQHGTAAKADIEDCISCHDAADPTCSRVGCHADFDGVLGTDPSIHVGRDQLGGHGPWHSDDQYFCYQCHENTHQAGVGFCGYCHGGNGGGLKR